MGRTSVLPIGGFFACGLQITPFDEKIGIGSWLGISFYCRALVEPNGTYIEYCPSAPISCRHRYWHLLTKKSVSGSWLGFREKSHSTAAHSISRTGRTGFSRAACNVFFNQRAEPYLFGLCRSDGEIRATKRHRRLEGSLQVHAVILSGYTETRRRSQSGSCGFATAKRIGTGGTKTGEKKRYRHRS